MISTKDRFLGCMIGLAAGDAVGTTVEFSSRGSFAPVEDMVGGGPFRLKPGEWTDDTSMALCLAASLLECQGFNPVDQLERYLRWWREGYMSSKSHCFDIGNTVRSALSRFQQYPQPFCGLSDPHTAGNGSIMRLAPVPMFFFSKPAEAVEKSGESSRTTHQATTAVDGCRYLGGLLVGALNGENKATLLAPLYSPLKNHWTEKPLCTEIHEIAAGSFMSKPETKIRGSGYVVESLEAALWAFATTDNFRDGCLRAVNLGDDADTTAAVYGQLAGAFYGLKGIPDTWRLKLAKRDMIEEMALKLFEQAG